MAHKEHVVIWGGTAPRTEAKDAPVRAAWLAVRSADGDSTFAQVLVGAPRFNGHQITLWYQLWRWKHCSHQCANHLSTLRAKQRARHLTTSIARVPPEAFLGSARANLHRDTDSNVACLCRAPSCARESWRFSVWASFPDQRSPCGRKTRAPRLGTHTCALRVWQLVSQDLHASDCAGLTAARFTWPRST